MMQFWILDFGFWIERGAQRFVRHLRSCAGHWAFSVFDVGVNIETRAASDGFAPLSNFKFQISNSDTLLPKGHKAAVGIQWAFGRLQYKIIDALRYSRCEPVEAMQ